MRTKGIALGFGLVGLGAVAGPAARGLVSPTPAATAAPAAAARPAASGVAAEGRVVAYPGAEVRVGAERGGRLVRVLVEEGDVVRKGQLLAEIESDELRAAIAEARARVAEAEAEARLAEANLARRRELAEQRIVAASDLDQATRDVETARARVETVRATVSRDDAVLAKSRIVAPISGTVVARRVDAGQMLEIGDDTFTVADLGRLRIEGEAHEGDAESVVLGSEVTITADGYPGHAWRGRVEEVPDSVTLRRIKPQDPSRPTDARILAVKVAFAEPTPLKLGATVDLRISRAAR